MTLQEAIEFLEDLQPDVCENCTMIETCNNAGTGICVEALNIIKAEAQRATYLQAKIDSSELERLRAENANRELLGLDIQDILFIDSRPCEICKLRNATWIIPKPCKDCDSPERAGSNWQWQHADKLKEIDGKDWV